MISHVVRKFGVLRHGTRDRRGNSASRGYWRLRASPGGLPCGQSGSSCDNDRPHRRCQ